MVVFGCAGDEESFVRTDKRGETESMGRGTWDLQNKKVK